MMNAPSSDPVTIDAEPERRRTFGLLFVVMLTIAAGNTALQSVLPALGRSLGLADTLVALAFSISAFLWVITAPYWARRSDRHGHKAMLILGLGGFISSLLMCGLCLSAGISGWLSPTIAFVAFTIGRMLYGLFGAAAPPAAQAMMALRTSRAERTRALTLLASAFGLGTILGPALAPFFVLPVIGLAGPAYIFSAFGLCVLFAAYRFLPSSPKASSAMEGSEDDRPHGAMASYPTIGGQGTGASVTAAVSARGGDIGWRDARIWPWLLAGLVMGHAQAMTGQSMGYLIIDRLALPLAEAQQGIGIVLMIGAGAALLAQWGIIPLLNLAPRSLVIWGSVLAMLGCIALSQAESLYGLSMAYALASLGFGFVRPGYTAGTSLAVGSESQGAVAGKVTAINGAAFVLGPSLGVGMYEIWQPLPYLVSAGALLVLLVYALIRLRPNALDG